MSTCKGKVTFRTEDAGDDSPMVCGAIFERATRHVACGSLVDIIDELHVDNGGEIFATWSSGCSERRVWSVASLWILRTWVSGVGVLEIVLGVLEGGMLGDCFLFEEI